MSNEGNIKRLLEDRVEFKLYAAEQHLKNLKEIENAYGDIFTDNARIEVEIEVDCFLSQLIGAVDSLLFEINCKLDLGIPADHVNFPNVQSALSAKTKKIDLLSELDRARQQGNWYYLLSELKHQSVHRSFLERAIVLRDLPSKFGQSRFLDVKREFQDNSFDHVVDIGVIPYMSKSLQQVRELILFIRTREPLLQQ
jgi:hypothetical protein